MATRPIAEFRPCMHGVTKALYRKRYATCSETAVPGKNGRK